MKKTAIFKVFAILSFFGIVFVSCQKKDESQSFSSSMQVVDDFIRKEQFGEALKLLKKSEKSAYNANSKLSLFKRYKSLGETKLAEKVLKKSIKKFPKNLELKAVYGQFLLREKRIDESEKITKSLIGSKYGSIHSEAVLKKNVSNSVTDFLSLNFADVYKDIYENTKNPTWLMNCALVYLASGEYLKASLLQENILKSVSKIKPETQKDAELFAKDSLFWALVQYDAENYDVSLRNLMNVTKYSKEENIIAVAASVASDCYVQLDEIEQAERARSALLNISNDVPDIVAVNSALWAYENKNYKRSYDLLTSVLEKNPSYAPALLTFGKIAWEDSKPIEMTDLEMSVRKTTLRTEKMREFDERPRFLVSDAIHRILKVEDEVHKSKKTIDLKDLNLFDALLVERLSLYIRSNNDLPLKAKTSEIWKTLEQNEVGLNLYPSLLVYYSVQKLISYGFVDDARQLFMNYINAKYLDKIDTKKDDENVTVEVDMFGGEHIEKAERVPESIIRLAFGDNIAKSVNAMNVWEVEIAAYFTLLDGNIDSAKRLYEFVLFESGGVVNGYDVRETFENVSTLATASSAINLSMIYSSLGEPKKALSLYGLAAGKCESAIVKSKILYRIANIQVFLRDLEQAKLSLDYSLSLDPQNAEARLLRRKISR